MRTLSRQSGLPNRFRPILQMVGSCLIYHHHHPLIIQIMYNVLTVQENSIKQQLIDTYQNAPQCYTTSQNQEAHQSPQLEELVLIVANLCLIVIHYHLPTREHLMIFLNLNKTNLNNLIFTMNYIRS